MHHPLDITIVVAWLLLALGLGLLFQRRASTSTESYFVADRSLPWWVIGTSMVATTFAADTPLAVCGYVAAEGIAANWKWWFVAPGSVMTVFIFSKLWRRAGVITEAELTELRYHGPSAAFLRGTKALWFGVFLNLLVIAWVMRAMRTIVETVLGIGPDAVWFGLPAGTTIVLGLFLLAVIYTVAAGLWGVVATDLVQFALAMFGSVAVAILSWKKAGGLSGIQEAFQTHNLDWEATTNLIPLNDPSPDGATAQLVILLGVTWWAARNVDGGSYLTQRLLSARDTRHASWGYLWFTVANLCLRPWPWIAVGIAGLALLGATDDPETIYPRMMLEVLPPGLFGLVVVSFLAAFMSTIDTHLHWGASLLVHDVYRRFVAPHRSDKHHLLASRVAVILLGAFGAIASFAVGEIRGAWELALSVTAGLGAVYVARWLWWRVTAWAELSAMAVAMVGTFAIRTLAAHHPGGEGTSIWMWLEPLPFGWLAFPFDALAIVIVSIPTWVAVCYFGPATPKAHLTAFYEKVRPGGIGWRAVAGDHPDFDSHGPTRWTFLGIFAGTIGVYGALIGSGHLLLGRPVAGMLWLTASLVGGSYAVWRVHVETRGDVA